MYLLQNNNWQASTLLRCFLAIAFMAWLATVLIQYTQNPPVQKPEITSKQPPSHIVIEQFRLPPIPKTTSKPQLPAVSKLAKQPAERVTKVVTKVIKQSPQTPSANKQQVQQVYQKLSDEAIDIQIAWPPQATERQVALDFMYQCVGVQFAVLNGDTLTKLNHTKLNQTGASENSDWVRVAQGNLSKKEQNWLNAYALTGTPIRLFPRDIDWRLAQYVAKALKGAPLTRFRAHYQVTNQGLQLTNISINNQAVTDSWTLYQGKC
jgi:hypothetical protein